MRLGIISALAEEQHGLIDAMRDPIKVTHGMRDYTTGTLWNIDAVAVLSRIGKVAAAMTAATLVEKFGVTHIIFTGVAGSAALASFGAVGTGVLATFGAILPFVLIPLPLGLTPRPGTCGRPAQDRG